MGDNVIMKLLSGHGSACSAVKFGHMQRTGAASARTLYHAKIIIEHDCRWMSESDALQDIGKMLNEGFILGAAAFIAFAVGEINHLLKRIWLYVISMAK